MISVIMLTHNRENLVSRAIESVLAQTWRDFEFIIVDNGSTDRSGAIADQYAARDDRIRVIHREQSNIGAGRNAGLSQSAGEYITFLDDDDWLEPDYLTFLYGLSTEHQAEVAICGTTNKAFEEKLIMTAEEALVQLLWRKRFNVGFPTKLIRRELFFGRPFSETSRFDDIYLMPAILGASNRVAYHGRPKYHVLRHSGNNSAWTTNHALLTPEIIEEYLQVYRKRTEWLCTDFPERRDIWQYFEWSFMISMVEKITRLHCPGCDELNASMKRTLRENRDAFYNSEHIAAFEKDWLDAYITEETGHEYS